MQSHFLAPVVDNSSDAVSFNKAPEEQLNILQEEQITPAQPTRVLDSAHKSTDII